MKAIATKQPTNESAKQNKSGEKGRSRSVSPLSTGMPLLQRKCACGGGCPRCQDELGIQTKLKIGEPGDKYEQEADHIADEVMRMPEPSMQRQIEPEEDEEIVQRKVSANPTSLNSEQSSSEISPIVHEVLNSPGQPLYPETRTFMESRFGRNFNHVNIHTNSQANEIADLLNARAFTVGHDIVFGAGQYTPGTQEGRRLVAHELTHTVQQGVLSGVTPFIQRQLIPPIPITVSPSSSVVVNAVDARQERSIAWYNPARYAGPLANLFRGDVTMTNIASMVANVIAFLNGERMHRLNIMDHGTSRRVEIGDDWLRSAADVSPFAGTLGSLSSHFASGAIVHMQNCKSGQNSSLICALAAAFGRPVYAGTGKHNSIYGFNLGDYVSCDPSGTFNPNTGRPSTPTPPTVRDDQMA